MENQYKSAIDKIRLSSVEKKKAKDLFHQMKEEEEEEGNHTRGKRIVRPVVAIAAGLALVVGLNFAIPVLQSGMDKTSNSGIDHASTDNGNFADNTASSRQTNHFSMIAYAKELTPGGKVYPDDYAGYFDAGIYASGAVSIEFEFPVECKGENIDTITYRIKQGAFRVQNVKGKSVVVSGEKLEEEWDALSQLAENGENAFYHSFTVKYDNQTNEDTWIKVADRWENWSEERQNQYRDFHFHSSYDYDSQDSEKLEKKKKVFDFLTKNMGITCTVRYKDGTTETKKIKISHEIVKLSEAFPPGTFAYDVGEDRDVVRYYSIQ